MTLKTFISADFVVNYVVYVFDEDISEDVAVDFCNEHWDEMLKTKILDIGIEESGRYVITLSAKFEDGHYLYDPEKEEV